MQPRIERLPADLGMAMRIAIKRGIDVVGSALGLVLCAPLCLIIAAAIRLDSPGPVLFRQRRVGRGGKVFTCLKFRTMRQDADQSIHQRAIQRWASGGRMSDDPEAPAKLARDPRVTRVGAILRRTSLDELPQLWNVLRGEMSLVGPRPAIPYELEVYAPWHHQRHLVKPGLTGLWQVYGRGRGNFAAMMSFDVQYATGWSLRLDVKLLLLTVPAVLGQRGAR